MQNERDEKKKTAKCLNAICKKMKNQASCGAGKCGANMKNMKSGSCGSGKCGSDMKKMNKQGSCGAGKCGANMKNMDMKPAKKRG